MTSVRLTLYLLALLLLSPTAPAQTKNGFDVSDASVPADEIRRTNVRRDGIPSIDAPKFVAAGEAGFLAGDDRVIGVAHNGIARAYPIRIMEQHEVVNDRFADEAVVVTYCPLCYTGMVFSAQASDFGLEFGVSGLLYNSDVLLYDRRTGSLWSQILGKAISGPLEGAGLPPIPASHTTWRDWRGRYPGTAVLSTDTGFRRNYRKSPYLDYSRSGKLMFPVRERSERFRNKELVLGIHLRGTRRAYPFAELEKHARDTFRDSIAGTPVTVEWYAEDQFARVLDAEGNELASVIAYWFAWYAFYPDTEIFRAGGE